MTVSADDGPQAESIRDRSRGGRSRGGVPALGAHTDAGAVV